MPSVMSVCALCGASCSTVGKRRTDCRMWGGVSVALGLLATAMQP